MNDTPSRTQELVDREAWTNKQVKKTFSAQELTEAFDSGTGQRWKARMQPSVGAAVSADTVQKLYASHNAG